jgi:hypothetical protein
LKKEDVEEDFFVVYLTTLSLSVTTERRTVGLVNNTFQSIRRGTAVTYSRYNHGIILEGLKTTECSVRTTGVPAEITAAPTRSLEEMVKTICL